MKIGTAETMKNIDNFCVEQLKLQSIILMENAALKVIKNISISELDSFVVICGTGNNGGDGLAVARHIFAQGKNIDVFILESSHMSGDFIANLNILKEMKLNIEYIKSTSNFEKLAEKLRNCDAVIDAIFGTGLTRKVDGIYSEVISLINENSSYIISIDVPSGMDSNSGKIMGNCVKADKTITFQLYKKGFISYGSEEFTGEIIVESIGIPDFVINKFHKGEYLMDVFMANKLISPRDKISHKGQFGRVSVIAGSMGYTGAAYISSMGAVKSGAGLTTLCCRKEIQSILSSKLAEVMTTSIEEKNFTKVLEESDAIAFGPGMGNNKDTFEILKKVLENAKCPLIIDADGLNVLSGNMEILNSYNHGVILTPHPGEMERLTGLSVKYINENRMEVANKFSKEYNVVLVLKGYNTVISDGRETYVNPFGNSAMASGGMGDCLTGIIVSLLGQGYEPIKAACLAVLIHGYAGEKLSKDMFCVSASSILEELPYTIKDIQNLI